LELEPELELELQSESELESGPAAGRLSAPGSASERASGWGWAWARAEAPASASAPAWESESASALAWVRSSGSVEAPVSERQPARTERAAALTPSSLALGRWASSGSVVDSRRGASPSARGAGPPPPARRSRAALLAAQGPAAARRGRPDPAPRARHARGSRRSRRPRAGSRHEGCSRGISSRAGVFPVRRMPSRARSKGVANGTRTRDHRDHNPGLYQLSYRHLGADRIATRRGAYWPRTAP
jgi:hypothetical protein